MGNDSISSRSNGIQVSVVTPSNNNSKAQTVIPTIASTNYNYNVTSDDVEIVDFSGWDNEKIDTYYDTVESAENQKELTHIKYDINWSFGKDASKKWQFGGYQGALDMDCDKWLEDKKIREIINNFYPDAKDEDIELLFYKINRTGCGYVAAVNTIFAEYSKDDRYDFKTRFGINPSQTVNNEHGTYQDYNYEYLVLEFYLYWAKNKGNYNTIDEVLGNINEEKKILEKEGKEAFDAAMDSGVFNYTGMSGTNPYDLCDVLTSYLADKGIDVTAKKLYHFESKSSNGYWYIYDQQNDEIKKYMDEARNGSNSGELYFDKVKNKAYTRNDIISLINTDDNIIMVDSEKFPLYYPYDIDGNGKLDDIFKDDIGGHVMMVVGTTDDPSKIVVSSWGMELVMDISDIVDINIINFNDFSKDYAEQIRNMKYSDIDRRIKERIL